MLVTAAAAVPATARLGVGALLVVLGGALAVVGARGWRGTLPRNRVAGVRTPATMASDAAFRLANRVAGPVLVGAAAVSVLGGVALLGLRWAAAFTVVLVVVAVGVVALGLAGGLLGNRAAAASTTHARSTPGCGRCARRPGSGCGIRCV